MYALLPPLLLRPHYVIKPWGGRRLAEELERSDLPDGPVGESWEVYDQPDGGSVVEGGAHDGGLLSEVLGRSFPLVIKVIDAREDLSIQVHPDGSDGVPAKEEAWVALAGGGSVAHAAPQSVMAGPSREENAGWLDRLECSSLGSCAADPASPPTVVHVPPGTVHAILGGSLLMEVQNPVDVTWRLDDHGRLGVDGRPRQLHLEEAGAVLRRPTPAPEVVEALAGGVWRLGGARFELLLHPPGEATAPTADAVFLADVGHVRVPGGSLEVPACRTVITPGGVACMQSIGWMIAACAL